MFAVALLYNRPIIRWSKEKSDTEMGYTLVDKPQERG